MIIRSDEIVQGDEYQVNGLTIFAYSHEEAIRKWLDVVFGKDENS